MRKLLGRIAAVLTVAAFLAAAPAAQACEPAFSTCSSNAFVNQPAPTTTDPNSQTYVNDLLAWTNAKHDWVDTSNFGVTVYTVPSWQPNVKVRVTTNNGNPGIPSLQAAWNAVPIPVGALPANGSDGHMVIVQPSTDRLWEFWGGTALEADGSGNWKAGWGGALGPGHTSGTYTTTKGYYTGHWYDGHEERWGATASSISVLAGLITASDLFSGSIDHAIAVGVPSAQAAYFVAPAGRTDGNVSTPDPTHPSAIPMGQEFYIPASVDLSKVPCHYALSCMIDRALQAHGLFVRDTTGSSFALYGEATTLEGKPDVWGGPNGFMAGQYPNNLLADVDWKDLVAANSQPERCCWTLTG